MYRHHVIHVRTPRDFASHAIWTVHACMLECVYPRAQMIKNLFFKIKMLCLVSNYITTPLINPWTYIFKYRLLSRVYWKLREWILSTRVRSRAIDMEPWCQQTALVFTTTTSTFTISFEKTSLKTVRVTDGSSKRKSYWTTEVETAKIILAGWAPVSFQWWSLTRKPPLDHKYVALLPTSMFGSLHTIGLRSGLVDSRLITAMEMILWPFGPKSTYDHFFFILVSVRHICSNFLGS